MFGLFHKKRSASDALLLKGGADRHSHILPGVDDGIRTMEDALETLSYLESQGLAELWLTPHIMEDVPNRTEDLRARFAELQAAYKGPVRLFLSAENMMDNLFAERLAKRDLLLHGEDSVLVETSTVAPPIDLWDMFGQMMSAGYRPLLAHPERYRYMSRKDYEKAHLLGVRFQLNLPSVVGAYGEEVRRRAVWLLGRGWYSMIGSDCHRLHALMRVCEAPVLDRRTLEQLKPLMK